MTMSIRSLRPVPSLHPLSATAARRERTSAQLATGKRIAVAGDDPAGLAIAARLQAAARGLGQGERNVAAGRDVLAVADGAMTTSQDDLARMRELAVQAQNGTLSAADRDAVQQEFDQLEAQLDQTAGGASFGGRSLLDGSASGSASLAVVDGAGGEQALPLPDARADALGVAGRSVADPATVHAVDAASERLAAARGRLGAADSALDRRGRQLGAAAVAAEEARSRIEDVDVAVAVASQARDRILLGLQVSGLVSSRRGVLDRTV